MTFLQLVQALHREVGASGASPTTVTGATGETLRFVNWIKSEWTKIQLRHPNWLWMRRAFHVSATSSDDNYAYTDCTDTAASTAISRFLRWYPDEFQIYLTSAGVGTESRLTYQDYEDFKRVFKIGSQTSGYPAFVAVKPDRSFLLGPAPDATYTVSGDYQRAPQTLSSDSDEPEMPSQFHDLIWMGAARRYASYESAPEVWAEFKSQQSELMRALEQDQLPPPRFAPPLA